jgi:hypothetical protein
VGDLASNSFEFYDGVRILVTGAILTAIYVGVVETFALPTPLPTSDVLTALSAVTLSGLFMYFLDIPGRSALYSAALPHRELERWKLVAPEGRTMQNVYFVLMDTRMPSGMRNRAQYYGSMYRIGFDAIVLFCLSGTIAVTAAPLLTYSRGRVYGSGAQPVMIVGSGLFVLLALCAFPAAYARAKPKGDETRKEVVLRELNIQIPCADRVVLLLVVGSAIAFGFLGADWMLIAAATLGSGLWLFRYLRGALRVERRGSDALKPDKHGQPLPLRWMTVSRRNIDASTATLLLCTTVLAIWVPTAIRPATGTHLSSAAAVGWTAAVFVGGTLMLSKGHEGKFWGSYFTVTTWLGKERDMIVTEFRLTDPATPTASAQPTPTWWRKWLGSG